MSETQILVAADDHQAQIRVIGRGTFACAQSIRDFGSKTLSGTVTRLLIDFSECTAMDSTFMGILAMLAQQKREAVVGLVNVDEYNMKLLSGLGIKRLFEFSESEGAIDWTSLTKANVTLASPRQRGEIMLEAHQTLIDADPSNLPKFTDVITFLKQDLDQL